jgi:hypothetical protein
VLALERLACALGDQFALLFNRAQSADDAEVNLGLANGVLHCLLQARIYAFEIASERSDSLNVMSFS